MTTTTHTARSLALPGGTRLLDDRTSRAKEQGNAYYEVTVYDAGHPHGMRRHVLYVGHSIAAFQQAKRLAGGDANRVLNIVNLETGRMLFGATR